MALWLVILISVGVSVLLGLLWFWLADKVDDTEDTIQRAINRVENQFALAGVTGWLPTLLEDLVVGDEEAVVRDVKQLLEAPDTMGFWIDQVAQPMAMYAIRTTARDYPDKFAKLVAEVEASRLVAGK